VLLVSRLQRLSTRPQGIALPTQLRQALAALVTFLPVLGLGSIPVSNFVADKDPIENSIEWVFTLLLFGVCGVVGPAFAASGFAVSGRPPRSFESAASRGRAAASAPGYGDLAPVSRNR
jgi:hypothetical protein